jgi:tRNA dimethylallyltransferase
MCSRSAPEIWVITGATATGKTALGVQLAQHLNTDVISCDSQLVYQGLNIGTAKPTLVERQGVVHWGMDLVSPNTVFTAALYQEAVLPLILERLQQHQPIILVGGTGFYIRQLLEPRTLVQVPPNPALRQSLREWALTEVSDRLPHPLYERLRVQDPVRATQLYPQDEHRLLRALEIVETTGAPVPQEKSPCAVEAALGYLPRLQWVGLYHNDRQERYKRIEKRVQAMMQQGWLDEVVSLVEKYGLDAHALQVAHGYPELIKVLQGHQTLLEAQERIAIQVRQYARRQKTWFNTVLNMHWCDVSVGLPSIVSLMNFQNLYS